MKGVPYSFLRLAYYITKKHVPGEYTGVSALPKAGLGNERMTAFGAFRPIVALQHHGSNWS